MEPLLTNTRAVREWQWIVSQVGEEQARAAIARIPGKRRPYPLNIARALGLRLPPELAVAPPDHVRQRIKALRELLQR